MSNLSKYYNTALKNASCKAILHPDRTCCQFAKKNLANNFLVIAKFYAPIVCVSWNGQIRYQIWILNVYKISKYINSDTISSTNSRIQPRGPEGFVSDMLSAHADYVFGRSMRSIINLYFLVGLSDYRNTSLHTFITAICWGECT